MLANLPVVLVLALALVCCGGQPFSAVEGGEQGDGAEHQDSGADAGPETAAPDADAASVAPDAATDDGGTADATSEAACTIGQPFACCGNGGASELTTPPLQFCYRGTGSNCGGSYQPLATPAECQSCGTYTCSCIKAHASVTVGSCSESNGQITATQ